MPTLDWIGKKAVVNHHREVPYRILKEDSDLSYGKKDSGNLIVEGDNLEALKALLPYYKGKVKCIYIDPPYNTGNEGWVYNDNVNSPEIKKWLGKVVGKEMEDLSRHDKWLCMMYPRLQLLREFLSDDGVIFISIDDNEYANLKLLCDEIFGGSNAIGPIIQNKMNAKNDSLNVQKNHEYILIYRKKIILDGFKVKATLLRNEKKEKDVFEEDGEFYYLNDSITTRGEGGILNARPNLGYTIYYNPETKEKIAIEDYDKHLAKTSNDENLVYKDDISYTSKGFIPIRPPKVRGRLGCWTWSLEKFNLEKKNIIITGRRNSYTAKKRTFVARSEIIKRNDKYYYVTNKTSNSRSIIDFSTNDGVSALNSIIEEHGVFDNPKNVNMIKYFISLIGDKDSLILDSFAGSGTTAHAVMELNKEDGGNRKFVCVEMLPEIAENITSKRAQKVIDKLDIKETDGFKFVKLGEQMFTADGDINPEISYEDLARHVYFMATGTPLDSGITKFKTPLIGISNGAAIYLLYNGILKDTSVNGGNRLTQKVLKTLPKHEGVKIIYGTACGLSESVLRKNNIVFRQTPYTIFDR